MGVDKPARVEESPRIAHQFGSRDTDDALTQRVQHGRVVRRLIDQVQQLVHEPRALLARV